MPKIIYQDSDGIDKAFELGFDPITIGRATECEINTQDAMVSRRHARLAWDGSYCWIEDLGSSNGVYVGREKVQRAPFGPGDVVTCGSMVLRMVLDAQPTAQQPQVAAAPEEPAMLEESAYDVSPPTNPADLAGLAQAAEAAHHAQQSQHAQQPAYQAPAQPQAGYQVFAPSGDDGTERQARQLAEERAAALEAEIRRMQEAAVNDSGDRVARQAAEAERDRMRQRLSDIQTEIEADRERFRSRIAELQQQMETMQSAAKKPVLDTEKAALKIKVEDLTGEINKLRLEAARFDDAERARQAAVAERDQLKAELDAASKSSGASAELEKQIKELREELREAQDLRRDAEAEADKLDGRVKDLKEQLAQTAAAPKADPNLESELKALRAELRENQDLRRNVEEERAELASRLQDLQTQLKAASGPKADPEKENLARDLQTVRSELRESQDLRREVEAERAEMAAKIGELETQLRLAAAPKSDDVKEELAREVGQLRAAVQAAEDRARAADEEKSHLGKRVASLEEQLAKPAEDPEKQHLQKLVDDMMSDADRARAQIDSEKSARQAAETERDQLMTHITSLEAQLEKAGSAPAADPEKDAIRRERDGLRGERDSLKDVADTLRGEADALRADLEAARRDLDGARGQAGSQQGEVDGLRAEVQKLKSALDEERARAASQASGADEAQQLRDELRRVTAERDDALADSDRAREQVRSARDEAEHAVADLKAAREEADRANAKAAASSAAPAAAAGGANPAAGDAAMALGDTLAELRASLRAASDEATVLPTDQVQVLADALSAATGQLEVAREQLRSLGKLVGAD